MPLIGRQPFTRQMPKKSLLMHGEKELFYCKHTNEIFADYESLFQRVILCNSLVWTCSLTSRPGLTFQEALESEKKARATLATFPKALKKPVLYLATLTNRTKINDLCEDVYGYMKDHYFVGEVVEAVINGSRKTVQVTSAVTGPKSPNKSPSKSGSPRKSAGNSSSPQKRYVVCDVDMSGEDIQVCHEVTPQQMNRVKGAYNKDKNKLFLKQSVALNKGILVVKDNVKTKNNLESYSLKLACGGLDPVFAKSPSKTSLPQASKKNSTKKNAPIRSKDSKKDVKNGQMDINKALMQKSTSKKASTQANQSEITPLTAEEKAKRIAELAKQKLENRIKARQKKQEEKRQLAEYLREFNKPREDLECDDLKDLPAPLEVKCNIPQKVFGDALLIIEFMKLYGHMFKVKSSFPNGISFELLDRAVSETDIDGPFNDMLQMLLLAVFKQQESEDEEQRGLDRSVTFNQIDDVLDENADPTTAKAIQAAKVAATWSQFYHGTVLRKMPLDPFTVSELFRLHILASGSEVSSHINRLGERGFYLARENPGLYFKKEEPDIVKDLSSGSVFQLRADQKIKVLKVLVDQLLTYESYREYMEEENCAKHDLKILRWNYSRRGYDSRLKKKVDENKTEKEGAEVPAVELSPEEKAKIEEEEKAKRSAEEAKALEDFQKKEKELLAQILKLRGVSGLAPIGEDRAFRRYWVLSSVGGIFVEDDNPFIGECSDIPTPTQPMVVSAIGNRSQDDVPLSLIKRYLTVNKGEAQNGQSDKENETSDAAQLNNHVHSKSQKLLSDANPRMNSPSKARKTSESNEVSKPKVYGLCTADMSTCPVHGAMHNSVRWSFFSKESEVELLISGLNSRGERESRLREFLTKEKPLWETSLQECPISKLNFDVSLDEQEVRKSNRYKSAFANVHPSDALEGTFREALLDNEEKLWGGGLGYIKVSDRDAWRNAILERRYEMHSTDLKFGPKQIRLPLSGTETMEVDEESESQRSVSPSEPSQLITDMACALLQVGQAVEKRYLISPLAEDAKYKLKKQKALTKMEKYQQQKDSMKSDDEDSSDEGEGSHIKIPASPMDRWEESLLSCTSLSQLFVHLATLEKSILWERSASKAVCKICRRRGDPEKMLLCDGCDRGYHMYCLKPPLKVVPVGDWFCPPCEPSPPMEEKAPQGRRILNYKESSDEEEEDDDNEEEEEEESDEQEADEENQNKCKKCHKGGELICCDNCSLSYHLKCLKPPLRRVPRGDWNCPKCAGKTTNRKRKFEAKTPEPEKKSPRNRKATSKSDTPTSMPSSANPVRTSKRLSNGSNAGLDIDVCTQLLDQLVQNPHSLHFRRPVTKKEAPSYHRLVKRPIDLAMIRSRLNGHAYSNSEGLVADIYLMFQNCELYYGSETVQYESGKRLARSFQTLIRQYKLDDSKTARKASFDPGTSNIPTKRLRRTN